MSSSKPASPRLVHVLRTLDQAGRPLTRSEIGKRANISRPTVSLLVDDLAQRGIVARLRQEPREPNGDGADAPPVGRRPEVFRLTRQAGVLVGVDIGHSGIRVALADSTGELLKKDGEESGKRDPVDVDALGPQAIDHAAALVAELCTKWRVRPGLVRGIGLGLPAPLRVEADGPTVRQYVAGSTFMPGWHGVDVQDAAVRALQNRVDPSIAADQVFIENDANIAALGEATSGKASDAQSVLYLKVSSGIGAGYVHNREIERGANGIALELGHMSLPLTSGALAHDPQHGAAVSDFVHGESPSQLRCPRCLKPNCMEVHASATAVLRRLQQDGLVGSDAQVSDVLEHAITDPGTAKHARLAITASGERIGYVLAQAMTILDPDIVVVGGILSDAGELLLQPIREAVRREGLGLVDTEIQLVSDRHLAGIRGALALVLLNTEPLLSVK
jgi:predicted NBD/HSP70 family sugar kinase